MTTFVDSLHQQSRMPALLFDCLAVVAGSLFLALCAQCAVYFWFSPVPLTLQVFGVLMLSALLGPKRGALAVLAYIGEGALGLPFFAGGFSGFSIFLMPTAGFLIGFVAAAYLVGHLIQKKCNTLLAMTLGVGVIYFFGACWLSYFFGFHQAIVIGVLPFLIGDGVKILAAAGVTHLGWNLLKKILIYLDEGVDPHAFRQVVKGVRHHAPDYQVQPVDRNLFLEHPNWEKETALLIFPGGRDIPYHEALKGEANQRIRDYVLSGGCYLGICAGAYYGASFIEFESGGALEVCAQRELAFFPGKAIGPVYERNVFTYNSEKGARIAQVKWAEGISSVYFNGGCYFDAPHTFEGVEVLAHYHDEQDSPVAAVSCSVGKGKALLCGVHPEKPHSGEEEQMRQQFWSYLLEILIQP